MVLPWNTEFKELPTRSLTASHMVLYYGYSLQARRIESWSEILVMNHLHKLNHGCVHMGAGDYRIYLRNEFKSDSEFLVYHSETLLRVYPGSLLFCDLKLEKPDFVDHGDCEGRRITCMSWSMHISALLVAHVLLQFKIISSRQCCIPWNP